MNTNEQEFTPAESGLSLVLSLVQIFGHLLTRAKEHLRDLRAVIEPDKRSGAEAALSALECDLQEFGGAVDRLRTWARAKVRTVIKKIPVR